MDGWISVKDGLPEADKRVLVFGTGIHPAFVGDTVIAITSTTYQNPLWPSMKLSSLEWRSPWQYFHADYEITHWMPLPEPPKEEEYD